MKASLAALAAFASLAACSQATPSNTNGDAPRTAASMTDLRGTWVGTGENIVTGKARHHLDPSGKAPMLDNVKFTTVIEGQDGHRFWGTLSSPRSKELVTGVVGHDGKTVVARTSEGELRGTLVDPDTIDFTYSGGGASTVVAVNTWKRQ